VIDDSLSHVDLCKKVLDEKESIELLILRDSLINLIYNLNTATEISFDISNQTEYQTQFNIDKSNNSSLRFKFPILICYINVEKFMNESNILCDFTKACICNEEEQIYFLPNIFFNGTNPNRHQVNENILFVCNHLSDFNQILIIPSSMIEYFYEKFVIFNKYIEIINNKIIHIDIINKLKELNFFKLLNNQIEIDYNKIDLITLYLINCFNLNKPLLSTYQIESINFCCSKKVIADIQIKFEEMCEKFDYKYIASFFIKDKFNKIPVKLEIFKNIPMKFETYLNPDSTDTHNIGLNDIIDSKYLFDTYFTLNLGKPLEYYIHTFLNKPELIKNKYLKYKSKYLQIKNL